MRMLRTWMATLVTLVALLLVGGCMGGNAEDEGATASADDLGATSAWGPVPAGTPLTIRLTSTLSSETARIGDEWSGTVVSPVRVGDREVIPAGSPVYGVVTGAHGAARGTRAMLDLEIRSVSIDGQPRSLAAGTEAVIDGSPLARSLGAIAGGTAAGATMGEPVSGDGQSPAAGGASGGGAVSGAVPAAQGYQVMLKAGTEMHFTVHEQVEAQ